MNPGNRITSFEPLSFRRMSDHKDRRSFLYTAAAGLVVGTHPWDGAPAKAATPLEPWLAGLNGQDKQFLDVAGPDDGKPLRHVDNFLTAYTAAYKLQESDISILFGAHEAGLVYVRSGALWHKFALGRAVLRPRCRHWSAGGAQRVLRRREHARIWSPAERQRLQSRAGSRLRVRVPQLT